MHFLTFTAIIVMVDVLMPTHAQPRAGRRSFDGAIDFPAAIQYSYKRNIRHLAYSPSTKLLAAAPEFHNFKQLPWFPIAIWELPSGALKHELVDHNQQIAFLAFTQDNHLLSGAADGMRLWDTKSGTKIRGDYGAMRLYDPINKWRVPEKLAPCPGWAKSTSTGKELYQFDKEANIVVWDFQTAKLKRVLSPPASLGGIQLIEDLSCEVSPDERFVALGTGLGNRSVIVWDFNSGAILATLGHRSALFSLTFSKNSQYLFAGGYALENEHYGQGVILIWEPKSWRLMREIALGENSTRPVAMFLIRDVLYSVNLFRVAEKDGATYETYINGYSIKTGQRVVSYDTKLPRDSCGTAAIFIEDLDAICIGGATGRITCFSMREILKQGVSDVQKR